MMKEEITKVKNGVESIKETNKDEVEDNKNEKINLENLEEEKQKSELYDNKINKSMGRRILGIITNAVLITTIIFVLIVAIRAVVFKKYDVFGNRFYIIMSGSMETTISTGDVVVTREVNQNPQKGDVVALQTSNYVTVHRIVEIYEENGEKLYETKGDNNNTVDARKIKISEIKGKVVYTIPKLGNAILFLKSHLIILVYIVAFIIIVYLIRRLM